MFVTVTQNPWLMLMVGDTRGLHDLVRGYKLEAGLMLQRCRSRHRPGC